MYDIDNLSCIIRAETLHIANDDQRIQTGKERERGRKGEKEWKREKREKEDTDLEAGTRWTDPFLVADVAASC